MYVLDKKESLFLATDIGRSKLKVENLELRYVPMVGFTMPEFGWHIVEKNQFFFSFKNPKIAYWFAYWMGELNCLNPLDNGKGIFHKVIALRKDEKMQKIIKFPELGF